MPGIIGVVGNNPDCDAAGLLAKMAETLQDAAATVVETHVEGHVGLGRVELIQVRDKQPVFSEDGSKVLVMAGEVFGHEDLRIDLERRGHRLSARSDAELLLHLYEERGDEFAWDLNGTFVAAVWDGGRDRLVISNDRLGLRPLYYSHRGDHLVFASRASTLLEDPSVSRRVAPVAVAEFFSFEGVLADRTFLRDVRLLPPGSVLTLDRGDLQIRPYWELQFVEEYGSHPVSYYVEGLSHYLGQAVRRRVRKDEGLGILLSGGLDSRTVLAYASPLHEGIRALTYGVRDSDDVRLARRVASRVGMPHHFLEIPPDFLAYRIEDGIRYTDGMIDSIHFHSLSLLPDIARLADVLLIGNVGCAMLLNSELGTTAGFGQDYGPQMLAHHDEDDLVKMLLPEFNRMIPEEAQADFFAPDFYAQVRNVVQDSFRSCLRRSNAYLSANVFSHFTLEQLGRRIAAPGLEVFRSRLICRMPLADNDLVEFMLRVPPGMTADRYLHARAFSREFPELAKIPYEYTGFPLVPSFEDLLIRADRQVRWRLRAAGIKVVSERARRPFVDYAAWMRRPRMRAFVEGVVLDRRTADRGYFNPAYLRRLVEDHMTGRANRDRQLCALLTFELWNRQVVDRAPAPSRQAVGSA